MTLKEIEKYCNQYNKEIRIKRYADYMIKIEFV